MTTSIVAFEASCCFVEYPVAWCRDAISTFSASCSLFCKCTLVFFNHLRVISTTLLDSVTQVVFHYIIHSSFAFCSSSYTHNLLCLKALKCLYRSSLRITSVIRSVYFTPISCRIAY